LNPDLRNPTHPHPVTVTACDGRGRILVWARISSDFRIIVD